MEPLAMDTPHLDPFAPWLGADDLELLQNFHATTAPGSPLPLALTPHQQYHQHLQHVPAPQSQPYSPHLSPYQGTDELQRRPYHAAFPQPTSDSAPSSSIATESFTALMTAPTQMPTKKTTRRSSVASSSSSSKASQRSSTANKRVTSSTSSPPDSPRDSSDDVILDEANMTPEELRREKNRQKVRRHYYRKLNHLNSLRSEVEQLELTFQSLLKQNETSRAVTTTAHLRHEQLMEDLEASRSVLEVENEQLRRLFTSQQAQYMQLRQMFTAENALFMASPIAKAGFIKPMSLEECHAVRDKAVADVMVLSGRPRRSRRGPGIAGWQDDVAVENGFWKFSLHKTFRNLSPASVTDRTWPLLTDPTAFSRLYSPAVEAKCVVVQRIDDRNLVLFQECRAMDTNNEYVLMKSLFLASRVNTPTGELTVIRGLSEDRLRDRDLFLPPSGANAGKVVWHDLFSWIKYDRAGLYGEDCVVEFGGSAPTVGDNMAFWSVEIIHFVVRWECAIHGPPKLLVSSDDVSNGKCAEEDDETHKARTPPVEVP